MAAIALAPLPCLPVQTAEPRGHTHPIATLPVSWVSRLPRSPSSPDDGERRYALALRPAYRHNLAWLFPGPVAAVGAIGARCLSGQPVECSGWSPHASSAACARAIVSTNRRSRPAGVTSARSGPDVAFPAWPAGWGSHFASASCASRQRPILAVRATARPPDDGRSDRPSFWSNAARVGEIIPISRRSRAYRGCDLVRRSSRSPQVLALASAQSRSAGSPAMSLPPRW